MLFTKKQQSRVFELEESVSHLSHKVKELIENEERTRSILSNILIAQQQLREAAYGLKKDGTPRAKPGRKAQ